MNSFDSFPTEGLRASRPSTPPVPAEREPEPETWWLIICRRRRSRCAGCAKVLAVKEEIIWRPEPSTTYCKRCARVRKIDARPSRNYKAYKAGLKGHGQSRAKRREAELTANLMNAIDRELDGAIERDPS